MTVVHCYTSATYAYLDRVRVLGETLRRHQPHWHFTLVLPDEPPPGLVLDLEAEPFDAVMRMGDLGIPDLERWIFEHDVVELCTAVKGIAMVRLLEQGADKVVYLDPDTAVFSSLQPLEDLLDEHDILLTPHQVDPADARHEILDNEVSSLKHGTFNLGFAAVAARGDGLRFAAWWRDRLLDFCFDDIPNGLFTDQRWCDLAPSFFPGLHVLRDPGYNVASWNLGRRPMTVGRDGTVLVKGSPLRFFHFTKVTSVGERMIERYALGSTVPLELLRWYRSRLDEAGVAGLPDRWWAHERYADGRPIPKAHRRAYRASAELRARFPHPFQGALGDHLSGA